ncbi:uncharacterized protein LOC129749542 [Uranotaenia lowii]|uniref:uncharacterized protein LOC129749542 n=1 Tax=Uranotaenia lowii TaxID=190385 RepID=UPI00247A9639|nr:uncharacterized protein LOC129749542 [Uranotaenia lowii]
MTIFKLVSILYLILCNLINNIQSSKQQEIHRDLDNQKLVYDDDAANLGESIYDDNEYQFYDSLQNRNTPINHETQLKQLSSYTDDEFAAALSKLSEAELDLLSRLIDQEELSEKVEKRENSQLKRECQYSCNDAAAGIEDDHQNDETSSRGINQASALRNFFTRYGKKKTTSIPTTTTRPNIKQATKYTTMKTFNKKLVYEYGTNRQARDHVEREVLSRINVLKSRIKPKQVKFVKKKGQTRRTLPYINNQQRSLGKSVTHNEKDISILEDSFPRAYQESDSQEIHIRVKRVGS